MKGRLFMPLAALLLFLPAVFGTSHLSFAVNSTQVNITRDGCGTDKLCLETPEFCDPAENTSMCLFMSSDLVIVSATNSSELSFELRGYSVGYIALAITMNVSQGGAMLFACAQNSSNNGSFFFRTARRNNSFPENMPTPTERSVTDIRGVVNDNIIRCEFTVPGLNFANINYTVLLGIGNVTDGSLDTFNVRLTRGPLNLTDPTSGSINPTSSPPTTPAPTPQQPLNINRTGCGDRKLCLETPERCDPSGNSDCLFASVIVVVSSITPRNGLNLMNELRGNSAGYIALGLTSAASPDTAMIFVCGQNSSNNGSFFFGTFQRNNSNPNAAPTPVSRSVSNVRGEVNGTIIRCIFTVNNINATQRNPATTFSVLLGRGTSNGSSIGTLTVDLMRDALNLGDPSLGSNNIITTTQAPITTTTTQGPTATTCDAVSSYPHALLLLSALVLPIILRN